MLQKGTITTLCVKRGNEVPVERNLTDAERTTIEWIVDSPGSFKIAPFEHCPQQSPARFVNHYSTISNQHII